MVSERVDQPVRQYLFLYFNAQLKCMADYRPA
jgi:hypothetical protein